MLKYLIQKLFANFKLPVSVDERLFLNDKFISENFSAVGIIDQREGKTQIPTRRR